MKSSFIALAGALLVSAYGCCCPFWPSGGSAGGAGSVSFATDGGSKVVTELTGGEFKDLVVRFPVTKDMKTGQYDVVRFYCKVSFDTNDPTYITMQRADFQSKFGDKSEAVFNIVTPGKKDGDFEYSTYAIGMPQLVDYPRKAKKATNTITVSAKTHHKTGEKQIWDEPRNQWITRPIYDDGTTQCSGEISIKLPPQTGVADPSGSIEVGNDADPALDAQDFTDHDYSVEVTGVRLTLRDYAKDKFGNPSTWMGMKVIAVKESDLKTGGKPALEFLKADLKSALHGERTETSWTSSTYLGVDPGKVGTTMTDWTAKTIQGAPWQVLELKRVAQSGNNETPMIVKVAIAEKAPHVFIFVAPLVEDGYFGTPVPDVEKRLLGIADKTMESLKIH